jgi:hypothetical protein
MAAHPVDKDSPIFADFETDKPEPNKTLLHPLSAETKEGTRIDTEAVEAVHASRILRDDSNVTGGDRDTDS